MDHVYPAKDYKEYKIKECIEELKESALDDMPQTFDDISRFLNICEDDLKNKSLEICRIYEDYGRESSESNEIDSEFSVFPQESLELNCIKFLQKGNLNFKEDRFKESRFCEKRMMLENENCDIAPYENSILTIRFYEPFKYIPCIKNQPRFSMEFQVLASNLLTELKDSFYCNCSYGPFFDISEYPDSNILPNENEPNPGFFYIHDTFYNDTRNERNHNYSDVILNWSQKFPYMREFKSSQMNGIKFEDLTIRIGYPCVYQHHGACEHIFCITHVDLIDSTDKLIKSEYPKLWRVSKKRTILCETCNQKQAAFIVKNCPLHVKDPIKLCSNCFFSFHYINRTKKTCEFNAYKIYSTIPEASSHTSSGAMAEIEEYEVETFFEPDEENK